MAIPRVLAFRFVMALMLKDAIVYGGTPQWLSNDEYLVSSSGHYFSTVWRANFTHVPAVAFGDFPNLNVNTQLPNS